MTSTFYFTDENDYANRAKEPRTSTKVKPT